MTLQEVADKVFKGLDSAVQIIAICEPDENGDLRSNEWDYADEMLELYGRRKVVDYEHFKSRNILAVLLEEEK